MNRYLTWLKNNPSGVTSISTALISASVAILILVLSQWILARRNRREFLTKKIEELYLLLNQLGEQNVVRFELILNLANKNFKTKLSDTEPTTKSYALDINKKIVMLIRLYFSKLSTTHQSLFKANREINRILHKLRSGEDTNDTEVQDAFLEFTVQLRNLEEEIIQNLNTLTKNNVIPRYYKRITQQGTSADVEIAGGLAGELRGRRR